MEKLKTRLDAFSDGIMAIIITIMVLSLPTVVHDSLPLYLQLAKNIGIYLISFFFVANMWYQHATVFSEIETITYRILLQDFIFLALLSLVPLFTEMMADNTSRITVISYGVLTVLVAFSFRSLARSIIHLKYTDKKDMQKVYAKIYGPSNRHTIYLALFVFILAFISPNVAIIFYLINPIWNFFVSGRSRQEMYDVAELDPAERKDWLSLSDTQRKEFNDYRMHYFENLQTEQPETISSDTKDKTETSKDETSKPITPATPEPPEPKTTNGSIGNLKELSDWLDQNADPRARRNLTRKMFQNFDGTKEEQRDMWREWVRLQRQHSNRPQQRKGHPAPFQSHHNDHDQNDSDKQ